MLHDYWLLSDLDGTLISTPHKAQGQYLPLTRSPCYRPLKRWLLNGGNVCIVTTADRRVIDQLYLPLRSCLAESEARCKEYLARKAREQGAGGDPGTEEATATTAKRPMAGKLLLSLYTGAVLFHCTAKSVYLLPGYASATHCATQEAVALTRAFNISLPMAPRLASNEGEAGAEGDNEMLACVRGTCIGHQTSAWLQRRVKELYMNYLRDVLHGEPAVLEELKKMSARYKRMLRSLLTFLENMFLFSKGQDWAVKAAPAGVDFAVVFAGAAQSAESKMWKLSFVDRCDGLLTALGILRVEYVEAEVFFNNDGSNGHSGVGDSDKYGSEAQKKKASQRTMEAVERRRQAEEADRNTVVEHAVRVLLKGTPPNREAQVRPVVESFARFMTELLGTDPRGLKGQQGPAPEDYDNVAQVILLGLPLGLFSRYFRKAIPDFVTGGVQATPQPNSVVFSKTGVSKSTTLRYLLGKERVIGGVSDSSRPRDQDTDFSACVRTGQAISLGDNPHTTDYELTVFRDLHFISVEKRTQREERHCRIQRRLQRTKAIEAKGGTPRMPDGSPAPSYAELVAAQRRSGPLMNDRLLSNVMYVGGEEEGTAVLLATLMDRLKVPPLAASSGYVGGEDQHVEEAVFQRTLAAARESANRKVEASLYSNL